MKKNLKRWTTLILTLLLIGTTLVPAHAAQTEGTITPRYNTNINVTCIPNLPDRAFST